MKPTKPKGREQKLARRKRLPSLKRLWEVSWSLSDDRNPTHHYSSTRVMAATVEAAISKAKRVADPDYGTIVTSVELIGAAR